MYVEHVSKRCWQKKIIKIKSKKRKKKKRKEKKKVEYRE